MITLMLAKKAQAGLGDQHKYSIYHEHKQREISFAEGHKYALIHSVVRAKNANNKGYSTYKTEEELIIGAISSIGIHTLIDNKGMSYTLRQNSDDSFYLARARYQDLVFSIEDIDTTLILVKKENAPVDQQNSGCLYHENALREIEFPHGALFAVVRSSALCFGERGYTTHMTEEDALHQSNEE